MRVVFDDGTKSAMSSLAVSASAAQKTSEKGFFALLCFDFLIADMLFFASERRSADTRDTAWSRLVHTRTSKTACVGAQGATRRQTSAVIVRKSVLKMTKLGRACLYPA
jgi:hypothetical protein